MATGDPRCPQCGAYVYGYHNCPMMPARYTFELYPGFPMERGGYWSSPVFDAARLSPVPEDTSASDWERPAS